MSAIRSKLISVAAVLGTLAFCQLHAGTIVLQTNVYSGVSRGGQFTATLDGTEIFQTFCLEYSEEFSPGTTYNYSISDEAISGDHNTHGVGVLGGDPISKGTAALYKAFRNGTLPDYFSGDVSTQNANADILQKAFWFLEDETFAQDQTIANNKYLNDLHSIFGFLTLDAAQANYGGTDVAALNVTTVTGERAQDQLYLRVPDGGTTIALLGAALMAIVAFRRRMV
jgi:VPDSG-CTERM motif